MKLHLNIVSPEKQIFDGDVDSVTLPATLGRFTILPHHAPIVSSLSRGKIIFLTGNEEQSVEIEGGVVDMSDNRVDVCVEMV